MATRSQSHVARCVAAAAIFLFAATGSTALASKPKIIAGTGSQQDPLVVQLPRPEIEDLLHKKTNSICVGYRGATFQQAGPNWGWWHPRHDSAASCVSPAPTVPAPKVTGNDVFRDGGGTQVGLSQCSVTVPPCLMQKTEVNLTYGPFYGFYQEMNMVAQLDPGVFRPWGGHYYRYVWGPPTTFCHSPQTSGPTSIFCQNYALIITAASSYTYFG